MTYVTPVAETHIALAEELAEVARQAARTAMAAGMAAGVAGGVEADTAGGGAAGTVLFEMKPDDSPVTPIDRAVEEALRARIAASTQDYGIIGEEYGAEGADKEWVWILDPIDGTRQFAAGLPNFGTLIALSHQGQPVIGIISHPWIDLTCIGIAGEATRLNGRIVQTGTSAKPAEVIASLADPDSYDATTRPGFDAIARASKWNVYDGGCLGYAALARGQLGIALNGPNLDAFDIAALIPVVTGAGGCITDWQGRPLDATSSGAIVASANRVLHDEVLSLLSSATAV